MDDIIVQCYSGYTYAQEPREFWIAGQRYEIRHIVGRWRTPAGISFRVATEHDEYILTYTEIEDTWTVTPLLDATANQSYYNHTV